MPLRASRIGGLKLFIREERQEKAMATFAMLVLWEIWKERNARVFQNHANSSTMFVYKIKEEAALWCLAGAKALCNIMP
jgi:hypothetical protein